MATDELNRSTSNSSRQQSTRSGKESPGIKQKSIIPKDQSHEPLIENKQEKNTEEDQKENGKKLSEVQDSTTKKDDHLNIPGSELDYSVKDQPVYFNNFDGFQTHDTVTPRQLEEDLNTQVVGQQQSDSRINMTESNFANATDINGEMNFQPKENIEQADLFSGKQINEDRQVIIENLDDEQEGVTDTQQKENQDTINNHQENITSPYEIQIKLNDEQHAVDQKNKNNDTLLQKNDKDDQNETLDQNQ